MCSIRGFKQLAQEVFQQKSGSVDFIYAHPIQTVVGALWHKNCLISVQLFRDEHKPFFFKPSNLEIVQYSLNLLKFMYL